MRMKLKLILLYVVTTCSAFSQDFDLFSRKELHLWAVAETGIVTYYGTLNKRIIPFSSNNTPSFQVGLNGQYKMLSVNIHFGNINYGQSINNYIAAENFKGIGKTIGFSFAYCNNYEKKLSFEIGSGLDLMTYSLSRDLTDARGTFYNYWSDGSIRDVPETYKNIFISNKLARDYNFETSVGSYTTILAGVTMGFNLHLTPNIMASFRTTLYMPIGNTIDKISNNQTYLCFNRVSLSYYFVKRPKQLEDARYSTIDFKVLEIMDEDTDGIVDMKDECPDTKKGAKVDRKGCLVDFDNDGIPDIYDKEVNTKKGLLVDTDGIGHDPSHEIE